MKTFYLNNSPKHHVNEYVNSEGDHYSDLISYETRVASYNHATNEMSVLNISGLILKLLLGVGMVKHIGLKI